MRQMTTLLYEKGPAKSGLNYCGEYRGRTDDLLHAMQAL